MERLVERAFFAELKGLWSPSVHAMASVEGRPAMASSSGASSDEQPGITRERTLYAPMNNFMPLTFSGGEHATRVDMR